MIDPIALEILGTKMSAAADEMAITLQRTGRTLYVKETTDFGTALATPAGKFFAYPANIGVSCFIDLDCGPVIRGFDLLEPGDVIITNHPYASQGLATHTPDMQLIKPYFFNGLIVGYGWSFVHLSDVGGRVPSSISPTNTELYQEGILLPPMKLVKRGANVDEVYQLFRANVRTPDENIGDINAMLAALAIGERRVVEMINRYGFDVYMQAQQDILEYAKRKALAVLKRIPNGVYSFWDYMDDDASSGIPMRLKVDMTVTDGGVELDFQGTDPQTPSPYNIPTGGLKHPFLTLRFANFICSHDPTVPLNSGIFDSISVKTRVATMLNPLFPTPTGIRHAVAHRVYEVVAGALAHAVPQMVSAASGGVLIPFVLAQMNPADNSQHVIVIEPLVGGMGALYGQDGVDGRDSSFANLGNNPIESIEASSRVRVVQYGLRADSGGPGKWRGGVGTVLTIEILQDQSMVLGRGLDRLRFAPWGLSGGQSGARTRVILNIGRADESELGKIDVLYLDTGDTVTVLTPGGGGYGNPFERAIEDVLRDIELELISVRSARDDYGVVTGNGCLDDVATAALRNAAGSSGEISRDTHRDAWESVFEDTAMARINDALFDLPITVRASRRKEIFQSVLPGLRQGMDMDVAIGDPELSRKKLSAVLTTYTNG